jgi:hypothetical protein
VEMESKSSPFGRKEGADRDSQRWRFRDELSFCDYIILLYCISFWVVFCMYAYVLPALL